MKRQGSPSSPGRGSRMRYSEQKADEDPPVADEDVDPQPHEQQQLPDLDFKLGPPGPPHQENINLDLNLPPPNEPHNQNPNVEQAHQGLVDLGGVGVPQPPLNPPEGLRGWYKAHFRVHSFTMLDRLNVTNIVGDRVCVVCLQRGQQMIANLLNTAREMFQALDAEQTDGFTGRGERLDCLHCGGVKGRGKLKPLVPFKDEQIDYLLLALTRNLGILNHSQLAAFVTHNGYPTMNMPNTSKERLIVRVMAILRAQLGALPPEGPQGV